MNGTAATFAASYREAAARHAAHRERQRRRVRLVAYGRLASFLGAAASLAVAAWGRAPSAPWSVAGTALLLSFVALVVWHSRIDALERWHAALVQVNEEAAARAIREWDRLPVLSVEPADESHPYAGDLDLFGGASVFQLLGSVGTEPGRRTLRAWLLTAAPPAVVARRQDAVRELAPLSTFREEFAALGRLVEAGTHDLDAFFNWADGPGWPAATGWLAWLSGALRAAIWILLGLQIAGALGGPFWLYPLLAGLVLTGVHARRIHRTFTLVFSRQPLFDQHASLFARIEAARFASPRLADLQAALTRSGLTAAREMAALDRLKRWSDLRYQALFHFPVNALTLWDLFLADRLERWRQRAGVHLREWFDLLGEVDALCALAALAHDNPRWAFPEIRDDASAFEAVGLGHPLLPDSHRIVNDVAVGPPGSVLLVTGSNMSGKSTLLRSIGVNAVLAQAGAPVCADRLVMPPLAAWTSMRVHDSLEAGVSYFMAALQRLKLVVDAARQSPAGPPRLLYLLDEVLQGTNTAERQVAVRHILGHLLALPVIGAVTTHDLELAASPELELRCRSVHFSEGVEEGSDGLRLSFDYRLRPGIATSRNALKLLRLVGLDRSPDVGATS